MKQSLHRLVIPFVGIAAGLFVVAAVCGFLLPRWMPPASHAAVPQFPPAFAVSTACLLYGSWAMTRAEAHVSRERQIPFRRSLWHALAAGTAFVGVQSFALSTFFRQLPAVQAATGATSFVAVAVALHGMHFLIAWLFVLFIVLQAQADRYDHEYYWGVTFCAWFWHVLVIIWLGVLCVMAIANQGLSDDGISWDRNLQG